MRKSRARNGAWLSGAALAACASRLYACGRRGHVPDMDLSALRISGIVVSGALIGGAVLFAMAARPPARPLPRSGPAPAAAPAQHPTQQSRQAGAYAISLRGDGPLARAQRLAMRGGRESAARRQVERELARQRAFGGLCFDRFTRRGDIVVHACAPGTGNLGESVGENVDWRARLRAMPAVTNVDDVSQLTHDQRGD